MSEGLFFISSVMAFAGYWFLRILLFTRLPILRSAGYHVLLTSLLVGGLMFMLSGAAFRGFGGDISAVWGAVKNPQHLGVVILFVAFVAFALPCLMNTIAKWFWSRTSLHLADIGDRHPIHKVRCWFFCTQREAAWFDAGMRGDVIQQVLLRSLCDREPVEFVLTTGESYIGIAAGREVLRTGTAEGYSVGFIPMMEAYRPSMAKKPEINLCTQNLAEYLDVLAKEGKAGFKIKEFQQMVVRIRSIVRVRIVAFEEFMETVKTAESNPKN